MGKEYRTARGKKLDMQKLVLQNEKTRAVGNMDVNARGDRIDSQGNIIETREQIMKKNYALSEKKSTLNPDED